MNVENRPLIAVGIIISSLFKGTKNSLKFYLGHGTLKKKRLFGFHLWQTSNPGSHFLIWILQYKWIPRCSSEILQSYILMFYCPHLLRRGIICWFSSSGDISKSLNASQYQIPSHLFKGINHQQAASVER